VGSLYRPKGSSVWWARYSVQGQRRRESTGTRDEQQARRWLAIREGLVAEGRPRWMLEEPELHRIEYGALTGRRLRQARSPLVYVATLGPRVLYVGSARYGLERPLTPRHHVLGAVPREAIDALHYFPVATWQEARRLEDDLITRLAPEWNRGRSPATLARAGWADEVTVDLHGVEEASA
jgi:hypothetical protein